MPRAAAVDPRGLLVRLRFGGAHLPQPSWFADASVQAEEGDPASTLSLYRRALALRRVVLSSAPVDGETVPGETTVWITGD